MGLSEDQAKHILNVLARKTGHDSIDVIKSKLGSKHNMLYLIACRRLNTNISYVLCDAYLMPIYICSSSYAKILEGLLEMSKDGKHIFCGFKDKLFLHAHTSLEEILIEMDLDNGLKRRKSKKDLEVFGMESWI